MEKNIDSTFKNRKEKAALNIDPNGGDLAVPQELQPVIVKVDSAYLIKRRDDLIKANSEVFNEFFYINSILSLSNTVEDKE